MKNLIPEKVYKEGLFCLLLSQRREQRYLKNKAQIRLIISWKENNCKLDSGSHFFIQNNLRQVEKWEKILYRGSVKISSSSQTFFELLKFWWILIFCYGLAKKMHNSAKTRWACLGVYSKDRTKISFLEKLWNKKKKMDNFVSWAAFKV